MLWFKWLFKFVFLFFVSFLVVVYHIDLRVLSLQSHFKVKYDFIRHKSHAHEKRSV